MKMFYSHPAKKIFALNNTHYTDINKAIMQGKVFQRCMHLLYCNVLSLGGSVYMTLQDGCLSLTWDPSFT